MIRNHYHINHNIKFDLPNSRKVKNTNQEKFSLEVAKVQNSEPTKNLELLQNLEPPKVPVKDNYCTEVTHSNGSREILFDKEAYEQAMTGYFKEKTEYDAKINEQNLKTAELQKQDINNQMNEERELLNQRLNELQTELNTNGTNSKMMTSIIKDLSAEYVESLQKRMEEKFKIIDNIVNNTTIPNPPIKTDSITDSEYELMLKRYNLEMLTIQKQQLEQEIQRQSSELKISKIDSELEIIRRLLFGNPDLTKTYYEI